jgi:dihydrofolate reductase
MIIMIAAASENNALGKNNELVWRTISKVQSLTSGHHIIMGRKTLKVFKPLPNRTHSYKQTKI